MQHYIKVNLAAQAPGKKKHNTFSKSTILLAIDFILKKLGIVDLDTVFMWTYTQVTF